MTKSHSRAKIFERTVSKSISSYCQQNSCKAWEPRNDQIYNFISSEKRKRFGDLPTQTGRTLTANNVEKFKDFIAKKYGDNEDYEFEFLEAGIGREASFICVQTHKKLLGLADYYQSDTAFVDDTFHGVKR